MHEKVNKIQDSLPSRSLFTKLISKYYMRLENIHEILTIRRFMIDTVQYNLTLVGCPFLVCVFNIKYMVK